MLENCFELLLMLGAHGLMLSLCCLYSTSCVAEARDMATRGYPSEFMCLKLITAQLWVLASFPTPCISHISLFWAQIALSSPKFASVDVDRGMFR